MCDENGRRAEREPASKRGMSGLCQAGDTMGSRLHFRGELEHLPASRGETAGPRQAINQPNVKRGLKRGKPPAHRRVVHFQTSSGAGKCADLRYGQEMPDIFPIDHLCGISRITRMYMEFPHRTLKLIFAEG
jgi:hypothetical protein